MNTENKLTQYANDLLEFYYPDWLNILSVYENIYNSYEDDFQIYDLYIYYEKNGKKIVDVWHWEYSFSINSPIGYIETNYLIKYNYEKFLCNSYFKKFIVPHLN